MAPSKKIQEYNPLKTYPFSNNRLLIIDWASLAYHQIFGMVSKKNTAIYMKLDSVENELAVWRAAMIDKLIKYIKLFNPMDIVLALEGTDVWRNIVYDEYYAKHLKITYDKTGYYVRFDNFLYNVTKDSESNDVIVTKLKPSEPCPTAEITVDKLSKVAQDAIKRIIPRYKGTRSGRAWDFHVDKSVWREYKDEFALKLTNVFRTIPIRLDTAEGDDVIYVAANHLGKNYDDVIIISGDSDLNQILVDDKVGIYNHRLDMMVDCPNPRDYIEAKILAGDTSDNINGMAFEGKTNQLRESGAIKLLESVGNVFKKAEDEGWDHQYTRNRKLIDLSYIPTDIQRTLCELLDGADSDIGAYADIYTLGLTDKIIDNISSLKETGYYTLTPKANVNGNSYRGTKHSSIVYLHDDSNAPTFQATSNRTFTNSTTSALDKLNINKNWM